MARGIEEAVEAAMAVLRRDGLYPGNAWTDGRKITKEEVEEVRSAIANAIWDSTIALSEKSE